MLSRNLGQILSPKVPFSFSHSKSAKFVKNFATNPEFRQFRQKSIYSSRWPVFVISSVFRQKRNLLEPAHQHHAGHSVHCTVTDRRHIPRSPGASPQQPAAVPASSLAPSHPAAAAAAAAAAVRDCKSQRHHSRHLYTSATTTTTDHWSL